MRAKVFTFALLGFFGGVLVSSYVPLSLYAAALVALTGVAFLAAGALGARRPLFLLASIMLIFAAAGILRFTIKDASVPKHELDNFVDENVTVTGVIVNEVEMRETNQRLLVAGESISFLGHAYDMRSRVLVSTDLFPQFHYGDRVEVSGKLQQPENFMTDTGREFDYVNYLRKDDIFYTISFGKVKFRTSGEGSAVKRAILSVKEKFLNSVTSLMPAPESSLLAGLLLGVKSSLGEKLHQSFIDTGLVHIIVLSGYNVTIIAEAVIKVLSFLSVAAGMYVGGVFIAIFAVMTGGGATIIRASIMAILALLARATGRGYEITRALFLAAFLMVFHNPYLLAFDISFQLSFLATLGLIYIAPIFERWFQRLPERFGIREIAAATFGVQVSVLPFILYKMGNLSLISPVTNILILPLIPVTMLFGFLGGALNLISFVLGAPFGFIGFLFLKLEITLVEFFAHLPLAHVDVKRFPLVLMLACYVGIFWYVRKRYQQSLVLHGTTR